MSKTLKQILLPLAAICYVASNAAAKENTSSPIGYILSEIGFSQAQIIKKSKKAYTPDIGYETVMLSSKNGIKTKLQGKNIGKYNSIDNIHLNLGRNKAHCEDLEKKLTAKYGTPISHRDNIRVWEFNNPDSTTGQSKKITVIAGEEKGLYFLTVDRKGPRTGNNPRTNSSLRKTSIKNVKRAKFSKPTPKIDRNLRD